LAEGTLPDAQRKIARREALDLAPYAKMPAAGQALQLLLQRKTTGIADVILVRLGHAAMQEAYGGGRFPDYISVGDRAYQAERSAQSALVRDIFGNPFRPVAFNPRWRTADVLGLARGIYEERAFDRLPLLADALMDAGCDPDDILTHCRSEGPHVRGCWVVDLVLGKE
jgi:hypothetical protein